MCLIVHFYLTKQIKVTLPCFSLLVVYDEDSWTMFHMLQYVKCCCSLFQTGNSVDRGSCWHKSAFNTSTKYQSISWVGRLNMKQGLKNKFHIKSSLKQNPVVLEILSPKGKHLV